MFNDRGVSVAGSPPDEGRGWRERERKACGAIERRTVVKARRKGREGRTQREIRRAACGLLGASQVELELANIGMTPRTRGEGQRSVPIERSGGTRLLRQVCPFVYSDQRADASSRFPLHSRHRPLSSRQDVI